MVGESFEISCEEDAMRPPSVWTPNLLKHGRDFGVEFRRHWWGTFTRVPRYAEVVVFDRYLEHVGVDWDNFVLLV